MERGIIDRFEGDIAVIEIDGVTRDLPRADLPHDVRVGDVLLFVNGEIQLDQEETNQRKQKIQKLMDELFED
jgi:hydrogenase maturation factor